MMLGLEWKASTQQRTLKGFPLGDTQAAIIQHGTGTTSGGKQFLPQRIINHAMFQAPFVSEGD